MTRICFTVAGPPPRKNRRHKIVQRRGRPTLANTARFTGWVGELWAAWQQSIDRSAPVVMARTGRWHLHITVYEKSIRHLDVDVPNGDADSAVACVKDGLQRIGLLDDDARIVAQSSMKKLDRQNPRVVIELLRWEAP